MRKGNIVKKKKKKKIFLIFLNFFLKFLILRKENFV